MQPENYLNNQSAKTNPNASEAVYPVLVASNEPFEHAENVLFLKLSDRSIRYICELLKEKL
jgi:hypothetical protein